MKKYALALDIDHAHVLIVGGGPIALRKIKALQQTGAIITVVAPEILPAIEPLVSRTKRRVFEDGDLLGQRLIFCCTDSKALNHRIAKLTLAEQLVNNTSDHEDSDFYNFATIEQGDISIHIGSDGHKVTLVKQIKNKIINYFKNND